jgi:hypothetical protein
MPDDELRAAAPHESGAIDALYRGFPDFSAWGRLSPDLGDLWARFAAELAERKKGAAQDQLDRAVSAAVRAAALDTGALEGLYDVDRGFTMSVALQHFAWQHAMAERGERVRALFEAQLAGYELAIDAVTGQAPPSEAWLRVLHERLCAPQTTYRVLTEAGLQEQPLPKGSYKEFPNQNQRPAYLDALTQADRGDHGPWTGFVADRGIDTMQLIVETLRSAAAPQPDEVAERLGSLFSPRGRSHAEIDNLALRLLAEAQARWEQAVGKMRPRLSAAEVRQTIGVAPAPSGYRRIAGREAPAVTVSLGTPAPAAYTVSLWFRVNIALDDANPFGFQPEVVGSEDRLDIRDAALAPEMSDSLKLRLSEWTERHLGGLLAQLDQVARGALKSYL